MMTYSVNIIITILIPTLNAPVHTLGGGIGCFGSIPCCICCPNPFKRVDQGEVGLVTKFGRYDNESWSSNFSGRSHRRWLRISVLNAPSTRDWWKWIRWVSIWRPWTSRSRLSRCLARSAWPRIMSPWIWHPSSTITSRRRTRPPLESPTCERRWSSGRKPPWGMWWARGCCKMSSSVAKRSPSRSMRSSRVSQPAGARKLNPCWSRISSSAMTCRTLSPWQRRPSESVKARWLPLAQKSSRRNWCARYFFPPPGWIARN